MADRRLRIVFEGDPSGAKKALGEVEQGVSKTASGLSQGFNKMAGVGKIALAGVGGAVALAAGPLFNLGKELELMGQKSAIVFGDQLGSVQAWARESATAMGLTEAKAIGLAGNFADLLIPMGFTRKEAADMSTNVVGLSGALAEWSGGTRSAAEVSDILAKAMLGEREGLKGLGISITEAEIQARLLEKGQQDLTGAQLAQAKATATQELIFEKSADAQAAFKEGSGSLARMQGELKTQFDNVKEQLATALIPVFKTVIETVSSAINWFKENEGVAKTLALVLGGILAVAIAAYTISMLGAAAATIAAALPILAIIAIVAGLAFGVKALWEAWGLNWDKIKAAAKSAADWVVEKVQPIVGIFNAIKDAIERVIGWVQRFIDKIKNIKLPGWLTGSKGDLEISLENMVVQMRNLAQATPRAFARIPAFAGAGGGTVTGIGGPSPVSKSVTLNVHRDAFPVVVNAPSGDARDIAREVSERIDAAFAELVRQLRSV